MTSLGRPVDVNLSVGSIGTGHLKGTTTVNANSGQVNINATGTFTHGKYLNIYFLIYSNSYCNHIANSSMSI